jgi:penicillin-binding protein 1C
MTKRAAWSLFGRAALGTLAVAAFAAAAWIQSLGPPPIGEGLRFSTVVVDREGRLLRPYATPEGRWRLPAVRASVDPRYLDMLLGYEDRRFYIHHGVDPAALVRAAVQLVRNGRIVSGGSTITMQLARLLEPREERSFAEKLREIVRAVEIERLLTKDEILALYLSLAPYGGNLEGIRAASLAYFGKEPKRLTMGEASLLVALPQSPEWRRPDRNPNAARLARDRVLQRATEAGVISEAEATRAAHEDVPTARRAFPKFAPHLAESEAMAAPQTSVHKLTIDRTVQGAIENLAEEQTKLLGQKLSAAVMVVDHTTGEVIAHVGSAGISMTPASAPSTWSTPCARLAPL